MTIPSASAPSDVLVVGGGPSGLLIAGILAQTGLSVTLMEARLGPAEGNRASTLHARAMEILDGHGVEDLASLPHGDRGHYVGLPVDLSAAPSPWAGVWRCPQPELERRLGKWALARGVRLRLGERVLSVVQDADHVAISTDTGQCLTGRLLIAADGARSELRRALGIGCAGPASLRSMVRADVRGGELHPRRFERLGDLTVTCAPLDAETTRVMVHDPKWTVGVEIGEDLLRRTWHGATGERLPPTVDWIDTFADTTTWAEEMVVGRVAFCGDAAHQFIPIGGAALNSALIGADDLADHVVAQLGHGEKDALVEHGRRTAALARTTAERLRREAALIFDVDTEARSQRAGVADRLVGDRSFRQHIVLAVSGLDRRPDRRQVIDP